MGGCCYLPGVWLLLSCYLPCWVAGCFYLPCWVYGCCYLPSDGWLPPTMAIFVSRVPAVSVLVFTPAVARTRSLRVELWSGGLVEVGRGSVRPGLFRDGCGALYEVSQLEALAALLGGDLLGGYEGLLPLDYCGLVGAAVETLRAVGVAHHRVGSVLGDLNLDNRRVVSGHDGARVVSTELLLPPGVGVVWYCSVGHGRVHASHCTLIPRLLPCPRVHGLELPCPRIYRVLCLRGPVQGPVDAFSAATPFRVLWCRRPWPGVVMVTGRVVMVTGRGVMATIVSRIQGPVHSLRLLPWQVLGVLWGSTSSPCWGVGGSTSSPCWLGVGRRSPSWGGGLVRGSLLHPTQLVT